MNRLALTTL